MQMSAGLFRPRLLVFPALVVAVAVGATACGGGGGGSGPGGAGQGLVLTNFYQAGQDNVPINRILRFEFSEPISAASVGAGSIQIRQGPSFGQTAVGQFVVDGATVYFKPRLPTVCGASDAGLQPDTTYRVTVMGFPEEFSVKNSNGQPLESTVTYEFTTRPEGDPEYLEDQIPATPPAVTAVSPGETEAGVTVEDGNAVVITFTENLDPCSVSTSTVRFHIYQVGEAGVNNAIPAGQPNEGNTTGFTPWDDQAPGNPHSWGTSGTTLPVPQLIPSQLLLTQDYESTELRIVPEFGRFPENALCVVELTFGLVDFGGSPLTPFSYKFTTENLDTQQGTMRVEFDRSTESWPQADRTADIDTDRSPGLGQGWLLFAGDGDNGNTAITPSFPLFSPFSCTARANDGFKDAFDPDNDLTLDTGSSRVPSSCTNLTDGSTAVVWEFATFRIRNGVTVTITGENPAIILVQGSVLIESGGTLRAKGGNGTNGSQWGGTIVGGKGGNGVAGGSDGGTGAVRSENYGGDGFAGYGSDDYNTPAEQGGLGSGEGNVSAGSTNYYNTSGNGNSAAGGGAGHATIGSPGQAVQGASSTFLSTVRGAGGDVYPDSPDAAKLYSPSAGSGGGGAGWSGYTNYAGNYYYYDATGAGGGAGGGFIDITSQADIRIYGMIDVSGGRGGTGGVAGYWSGAGGGGGSGGSIRLLTPANIDVTGGTLSTAGGPGGPGSSSNYNGAEANKNNGGAGGSGYIGLEDGDAVITGLTTAVMTPPYGGDGFYLGAFNSARFQGGGLEGEAVSGPMLVGPLNPPTFVVPTAADFRCAIPANASRPPNGTSILIEAAGYPIKTDGTVDLTGGDFWYTIGYFSYSGAPNEPTWTAGSNPPDVTVSNSGAGINWLSGNQFLRFRLRFFLPDTIGATTPGPWIDWMELNFTYDQ